jgi:hypothetical protein
VRRQHPNPLEHGWICFDFLLQGCDPKSGFGNPNSKNCRVGDNFNVGGLSNCLQNGVGFQVGEGGRGAQANRRRLMRQGSDDDIPVV